MPYSQGIWWIRYSILSGICFSELSSAVIMWQPGVVLAGWGRSAAVLLSAVNNSQLGERANGEQKIPIETGFTSAANGFVSCWVFGHLSRDMWMNFGTWHFIPSLQACLSACSSSVVLKVWACFLWALHCGLGIVLLEPVVFCLDRKHTPTPVHPIDRTQAKHVHLIMIKLKFNLKESTDSKQEREERAHLILDAWPRSKCPLCRLTFDSHAESQGLGAWCCRRH